MPKSAAPRKPRAKKTAPSLKVAVAYVHDDADRVTAFEDSLWAMKAFDEQNARVLGHGDWRLRVRYGTDGLVAARNTIAVTVAGSDLDYVLMVDTDMGFAPDALYQLLAAAHPETRPIVGGLAFAQRQYAHDGLHGFRTSPMPTIYNWGIDDAGVHGFKSRPVYPVNTIVPCMATGAAFLLVHRSVFARIAAAKTDEGVELGPTWFERTPGPDGRLMGEDVSFCIRAAIAGIPLYVHTGVKTSHYKHRWLSEADHWRALNPPPATDEVAVVVPVLRRPQNAAPFMRSLRASTGLATVYAIADDDDPETAEAWAAAGAQVIVGDKVTFAKKFNLGYTKTSEPWLFLTGDDVKFHPGWLDHAQHVADILKADVVGTNDLGNARVMAGDHATHMLIRRSYVDEVGASWDGPGVATHEGYRHWYVDNELVDAAKMRGVWQMALGSVVEHLHPIWGKAENDEVYELGQSTTEADAKLFKSRLAANAS